MQPVGQKKRSPWFYIGLGCGIPLLLGILGVGAVILFTVNKVQEFQEDLTNPIARTEKVKKLLGASRLPEGYYAFMVLTVPGLMDTAALSTHALGVPDDLPEAERRFFMYLRLKASTSSDVEELREYLEGRSEHSSLLSRNSIRVQTKEILGRGALSLPGYRLLYLSQRGSMETGKSETEGPGLNSIMLLECPGEAKVRLGLWSAPDPSPEAPAEALDVKGTPVDEKALRAFMSHFNPCQES